MDGFRAGGFWDAAGCLAVQDLGLSGAAGVGREALIPTSFNEDTVAKWAASPPLCSVSPSPCNREESEREGGRMLLQRGVPTKAAPS